MHILLMKVHPFSIFRKSILDLSLLLFFDISTTIFHARLILYA